MFFKKNKKLKYKRIWVVVKTVKEVAPSNIRGFEPEVIIGFFKTYDTAQKYIDLRIKDRLFNDGNYRQYPVDIEI